MQQKRKREKIKKNKNAPASNSYFDQEAENAIVAYQQCLDPEEKSKIFIERIRPSFLKLVENIIFVYSFHTLVDIDVLKYDCLSALYENLNKFDHTRGSKAFSYFNVCAKNWFIQKIKYVQKKSSLNVPLDKPILSLIEKENIDIFGSFEHELLNREFIENLKIEVKSWRAKFTKQHEKIVLEGVILLLENPDVVSIFNKKAIFLYLREICDLNTKQLVINLNKIKKKYLLYKQSYYNEI